VKLAKVSSGWRAGRSPIGSEVKFARFSGQFSSQMVPLKTSGDPRSPSEQRMAVVPEGDTRDTVRAEVFSATRNVCTRTCVTAVDPRPVKLSREMMRPSLGIVTEIIPLSQEVVVHAEAETRPGASVKILMRVRGQRGKALQGGLLGEDRSSSSGSRRRTHGDRRR